MYKLHIIVNTMQVLSMQDVSVTKVVLVEVNNTHTETG